MIAASDHAGCAPHAPRITITTISMDLHEIEACRREERLVVRIKPAGDPGEERADDKGGDLVARRD